jgi:hypothetical protein
MPDAAAIVELYSQRKRSYQGRMAQMDEVRRAYNGDLDVPLPELDRNERPMVANLITQGVDQTAMRIVSTMPNVSCPPMRPGFEVHEENANDRRNALMGFWTQNRLELLQARRARWLVTYASAPVMVRPDPRRRMPYWHARSPLTAYPPPGDDLTPHDMVFSFKKSLGWLRRIYPDAAAQLDTGPTARANPDAEFTIVEFCDHDVLAQVVLGRATDGNVDTGTWGADPGPRSGRPWVELDRLPNKAGICPAVNPTRIGLDDPVGQFDGLVGLFWNQAMLMALEVIAVKRAIFEDEWIAGRPGETPQIITEADGLAGVRGEISGANIIKLGSQPGVMTYQTLDRIERAMRLSGGIPAEMTGESASNIRTARRGAQVLSSTIDFAIAEAQKIFEAALEEENVRAIAIDKAYFTGPKSYYYSWNGKRGRGSYDPAELWTTDENEVRYSFPGADINELIVGIGQRLGMETISHHRAMELDPLIDDPELERDRVAAEGLERAFMQGLQQQVSQGAIPPDDAAYIVEQVVAKRVPLFEAVQRAQRRAQARQASQPSAGPAGQPAALPPGAPEAQPGLAAGPEGAGAAIAEPNAGQMNLQSLMTNLRRTSQPVG